MRKLSELFNPRSDNTIERKSLATKKDELKEKKFVEKVMTLLYHYFWFIETIEETERYSYLDSIGVDLVLAVCPDLADVLGFSQISVQVKSSETGVMSFFEKGQQLEKEHGHNWRDKQLVVLNAPTDSADFFLADFIEQLLNLLEAKGADDKVIANFFSFLPDELVEIYEQVVTNQVYNQYRAAMLAWVRQQQ